MTEAIDRKAFVPESPPDYDERYDATSLFTVVDLTTPIDTLVRPGITIKAYDFLNERFQEIIEAIDNYSVTVWSGEKLSTLCYRYHGVTSTKLLVLAFNGLSHEMQLRPGMSLKIPTKVAIDSALKAQANAVVETRTVTI